MCMCGTFNVYKTRQLSQNSSPMYHTYISWYIPRVRRVTVCIIFTCFGPNHKAPVGQGVWSKMLRARIKLHRQHATTRGDNVLNCSKHFKNSKGNPIFYVTPFFIKRLMSCDMKAAICASCILKNIWLWFLLANKLITSFLFIM